MRYGWKWLCYCPENEPVGDMITDIAEMFVGKSSDKDRNDRMKAYEFSTAIDWVLDHFTILSFEEQPSATDVLKAFEEQMEVCLLYTSPSPRDRTRSRMPSSA